MNGNVVKFQLDKWLRILLLATFLSSLGIFNNVGPVGAGTDIQLVPVDDGFILDQSPFDGTGDAVEDSLSIEVFFNLGVAEFRGAMEFDMGFINSSFIESAFLYIIPIGRSVPPGTSTMPIQLFGYSGDGVIGTDDFNAGSFITVFDGLTAPFNVPVILDVTEFLKNHAQTQYVGFTLRTDVGGGTNFGSLELGTSPILRITVKAAMDVEIDIMPSSGSNPINTKSMGNIPVAILSTSDFDAPSIVDTTTLTFGRTGDESSLAFCNNGGEDVNGDGLLDLVCHFKTQSTQFQVGDTEGILKGQMMNGTAIEGRDAIRLLK